MARRWGAIATGVGAGCRFNRLRLHLVHQLGSSSRVRRAANSRIRRQCALLHGNGSRSPDTISSTPIVVVMESCRSMSSQTLEPLGGIIGMTDFVIQVTTRRRWTGEGLLPKPRPFERLSTFERSSMRSVTSWPPAVSSTFCPRDFRQAPRCKAISTAGREWQLGVGSRSGRFDKRWGVKLSPRLSSNRQSALTTENGGPRRVDAGKRIKGRKPTSSPPKVFCWSARSRGQHPASARRRGRCCAPRANAFPSCVTSSPTGSTAPNRAPPSSPWTQTGGRNAPSPRCREVVPRQGLRGHRRQRHGLPSRLCACSPAQPVEPTTFISKQPLRSGWW